MLDPETHEFVGISKIAAQRGVLQSVYARWMHCVPIFFCQPIFESAFRAIGIMPKGGPLAQLFNLAFIGTGLWIAMPICAGFYRNNEHILKEDLEEDIRAKMKPHQTYLIYNKGV